MKRLKKAVQIVDEVDHQLLLEERIEQAYIKWDEWVSEPNHKFDILTVGEWEEESPNILKRYFTYDASETYDMAGNEVDEEIYENIVYIKFKPKSVEIVDLYTADE